MISYENGTKDIFNKNFQKNESSDSQAKDKKDDYIKNEIIKPAIDLGRVSPISNKYVFINSIPLSKYEVVFSFMNMMPQGFLANSSQIAGSSIQNANFEAAQQGKLFDAIIVSDNTERDIAIKFTNLSEDFSLCKVKKVNGILAFIGCEPTLQYNITGRYYQIHTPGTNPIFGDYNASYTFFINKAIEWGRRKKVDFDALYYCNLTKCEDLLINY